MIEINNLSFGYNERYKLFMHMNLALRHGGICGLLGKNGSGKSTLLKLLAGLVFPTQGSCQVIGKIPAERQPSFLKELYFLPEDLYVPALTPIKYVRFYAPFYPKFDRELFQHALTEFGLPHNKLLTNFSYGQKKKFLIAFGLATRCQVFILDEPTNGLDIPSKTVFRKLLASVASDEKLFIISTHQVHDIENLIDSLLILENGEIIFNQDMAQIAKQVAFVQQQTEPDLNACLYYEKQLTGFAAIIPNEKAQDTQIDIEILFNAILANKAKMQAIFNEVKSS